MDTLNYDFTGNSTSNPVRVTMRGEVPKYNTRYDFHQTSKSCKTQTKTAIVLKMKYFFVLECSPKNAIVIWNNVDPDKTAP